MAAKKSQRTAEAKLASSRQGISKPLVIGIIALVAILALASLLLFSNVFVGKAISFQALNSGEAGFAIDQQVNTLKVGEVELFPVKVNLGAKKSSVVSFELNYDQQKLSPDCSKIYDKLDKIFNYVDEQNTGLVVIRKSSCADGKVTFTYGALADKSHLITGQQTLAEITFTALNSPGQTSLKFTPDWFKVYDLESVEPKLISLQVKDGVIKVQEEEKQFEQPPVCGDSKVENPEQCDDGNQVNGDGCSTTCTKEEVKLQCVDSPSGIVSWWAGDGNSNDLTGEKNGVLKSGAAFSSGKVGQAFKLDGVDDYIEVADDPSFTSAAFTVSAWINLDDSTNKIIVSKNLVTGWFLQAGNQGKLFLRVNNIGVNIEVSSQKNIITAGKWYHVAVTYDAPANTAKMYVDGQDVLVTISKSQLISPADNDDPLLIGAGMLNGQLYKPFQGIIDEVAFWNKALTAAEVKSIYAADSAGMCKPVQPHVCGNGIVEDTEQCDDGNQVNDDGCSNACQSEEKQQLQVCTPHQYVCDGTAARKLCKPDGLGYEASDSCAEGEVCDAGECKAAEEKQLQGKQGIKITLTEVAPANNVFSTKVTATETFADEVTIYTTLYDANGKVLALKLEKLTGLEKGQTYIAATNYPEANVKQKSVIVYDVKQNPTVFGSLTVEKP